MQNIIRLIISMQLFVALCHGDLVYEFYSANTLMRVEITDETYGVIVANPGGTFARRVTGTDTFVALTQAELDDLVLPPPIPPEPEPLLAIYANAAAQVEAQAPLLDDHPSAEDVPAPGMFYRLANEDDETIQELWYVRAKTTAYHRSYPPMTPRAIPLTGPETCGRDNSTLFI